MVTFEIFNYKKQIWEEVKYETNKFDGYVIEDIVKYETKNDWRIRLDKQTK